MARIPMVTRTIPTTSVTVFCVNTDDRSTFEQSITLPRTYKDETKMMKVIENVFAGSPVKPVSILGFEVNKALYGMTEQEFLNNAQLLPDRDKKEN